MRKTYSLNGEWDFSIPGGPVTKRIVPSSHNCVGESVYQKRFSYAKTAGNRVLLCFEGVAYEGELFLNGHLLGSMLPYVIQRFDITDIISEEENELRLNLRDIFATLGPQTGWQNYGGIVRDVYLLELPGTYIENVFFHAEFENGYRTALCHVELQFSGEVKDAVVSLRNDSGTIAEVLCEVNGTSGVCRFQVENPNPWSPDSPCLYELEVNIGNDTLRQNVGFKEFKAVKNMFYLNGKRIFLSGVCRHDMQPDPWGFTQTDDQIEKDMRMIKALGANYVRLVHYPHDRRVLDVADRLGLLVSGEPGFWWSDLKNEDLVAKGLAVMELMIRRDRNHVSVAFWLTFNECILNEAFLKRAVETTKKADPYRLVSGANCMEITATKRLFDAAGCDFYTFHPYGPEVDFVMGGAREDGSGDAPYQKMTDVMMYLSDKPLLFTEWGGNFVYNNPTVFEHFCKTMMSCGRNESPKPVLAGMSYWMFADIYEYNRPKPGCFDGVLIEGLVDINRKPRVIYDVYRNLKTMFLCPPETQEKPEVKVFGIGDFSKQYQPVLLPETGELPEQQTAWGAAVESTLVHQWPRRRHVLEFGPALPYPVLNIGMMPVHLSAGKPLIADIRHTVSIPVNSSAEAICFIGQASFSYGYPVDGNMGDMVGSYHIQYKDGSVQIIPLRNGMEVLTVHKIHNASIIEPMGTNVIKVMEISYDRSFEVYQANLLRIPTVSSEPIESIGIEICDEHYSLLLYGITLEKSENQR